MTNEQHYASIEKMSRKRIIQYGEDYNKSAATLGTVATDLTQKLMPRSARAWLQTKTGMAPHAAGQERAESDVVVALQQAHHAQPARRVA